MSNQNKLSRYCRHQNVPRIEELLQSDSTLDVLPEDNMYRLISFLVRVDNPLWSTVETLLQYHIDNRLNVSDKGSNDYLHDQAKLVDVLEHFHELEDAGDLRVPESVYKLCKSYVMDTSDDSSECAWDDISLPDYDSIDDVNCLGSDATDSTDGAVANSE